MLVIDPGTSRCPPSLHKYSFFCKNCPNLLHNLRFCITIKEYHRFKSAV